MKKMSILVVDDLEDNRDLLVALLEDEDYDNILEAADGDEAIATLEGGAPVDLVLLDVNMPGKNGYEVLEHIKANETLRDIGVLMVTALDELQSAIRCIRNGAEDYLTKPVEEALLQARVQASLERKYLRNREKALLAEVRREKDKSEAVLYNVLPETVTKRLRDGERNPADNLADVTVIFADLVGFTALSTKVGASELVLMLNDIFGHFDELAREHRVEKIKTIGDCYMVVAGIPPNTEGHAETGLEFARELFRVARDFNAAHKSDLHLRVGMASGPAVAGVIGHTRFSYDIWGETVNMASRMEELGLPDKIQMTNSTKVLLGDGYDFTPRKQLPVKGKGEVDVWLLDP